MLRLRRIISGGQTGADQAALFAGEALGLETGGYMPFGYKTEDGPMPNLAARFGLLEHESPLYPRRTWDNVAAADGTLVFGNLASPGSRLTARYAKQMGKPLYRVSWTRLGKDLVIPDEAFRAWLALHSVRTLNVAGNRESQMPGIRHVLYSYLTRTLGETCAAAASP
jgi:hypothetical protein